MTHRTEGALRTAGHINYHIIALMSMSKSKVEQSMRKMPGHGP